MKLGFGGGGSITQHDKLGGCTEESGGRHTSISGVWRKPETTKKKGSGVHKGRERFWEYEKKKACGQALGTRERGSFRGKRCKQGKTTQRGRVPKGENKKTSPSCPTRGSPGKAKAPGKGQKKVKGSNGCAKGGRPTREGKKTTFFQKAPREKYKKKQKRRG